jgi:hypothetical protein
VRRAARHTALEIRMHGVVPRRHLRRPAPLNRTDAPSKIAGMSSCGSLDGAGTDAALICLDTNEPPADLHDGDLPYSVVRRSLSARAAPSGSGHARRDSLVSSFQHTEAPHQITIEQKAPRNLRSHGRAIFGRPPCFIPFEATKRINKFL